MENARFNFRVSEETKALFVEQFELSNHKNANEFLLSLLGASVSLAPITSESSDKVEKKPWTIRMARDEKDKILNVFFSSTEKRMGDFLVKCVENAPIKVEQINRLADNVSIELRKIGSNLNQIALRSNQIGGVDREVIKQLDEIKSQLLELKSIK